MDTTPVGADRLKDPRCAHSAPRNPVGGKQPNLLYADGEAATKISAYVETPESDCTSRTPVSGQPLEATVEDQTTGTLLTGTATTDPTGWAQFDFSAAPGSSTPGGSVADAKVTLTAVIGQSRIPLASTHVFSYNEYDFLNLPITLADLTAPGLTTAQIQHVFESYDNQPSFLANGFFKGKDFFIDAAGRCAQNSQTACDFDPQDPWYAVTDCPACDLHNAALTPVSAAQAFQSAAAENQINPFALLARAQLEQGFLARSTLPSVAALNWAMGDGPASTFLDQIGSAAATYRNRMSDAVYAPTGAPIPADGPFFFSTREVPIDKVNYLQVIKIGHSSASSACSVAEAAVPLREHVAFTSPNRANYVLWRYTPWVQVCAPPAGGGNRYMSAIVNKLHSLLVQ